MKKALLIIDLQNDYFDGGAFPLWNTDKTLDNLEKAIEKAKQTDVPVIFINHIADKSQGLSPFFNEGTKGAETHERMLKAAPNAEFVYKAHADGFHETNLEEILSKAGVEEILVCGMMTQNCVTHTAISNVAKKYNVKVIPECCTTVDEMINSIALEAISTKVGFVGVDSAF